MRAPTRFFPALLSALACALAVAGQGEPAPGSETPANLLRPGDRLHLQVAEDSDAQADLVVMPDGFADVPLVGGVRAGGRPIEAFAAEVKAALEKDYYVRATVRILLSERPEKSSNRGRVFITGEVRRVGMVEIDTSEQNTAGKVILMNGGLGEFADPKNIRIYRAKASGPVESQVVDLRQVLDKGRIDKDVAIHDGDLIVVGSRLVNW